MFLYGFMNVRIKNASGLKKSVWSAWHKILRCLSFGGNMYAIPRSSAFFYKKFVRNSDGFAFFVSKSRCISESKIVHYKTQRAIKDNSYSSNKITKP